MIYNLGTLVYNLHSHGAIEVEQCNGICGEINSLDKKIESFKTRIQEMESMRTQQNIYGESYGGAPFETMSAGIRCSCGYVNKEGANFCASCGKPIA